MIDEEQNRRIGNELYNIGILHVYINWVKCVCVPFGVPAHR